MIEEVQKPRVWLAAVGYAGLFVTCFVLFAYWTFPYDRLSALAVDRVAQSGAGYDLSIGRLAPYWLTGVELADVKLQKRAESPAEVKAAAASALQVQSMRARLALIPLLWGARSVTFDAALDQGELSGTFAQGGDAMTLVGELSRLNVGKLGVLDSVLSVPVLGELTGNFDLRLEKEVMKSAGTVELTLKGLVIGDGKAKQKLGSMGGLTIDPIEVGDVRIALEVKDGSGAIKELKSNGKDLKLEGKGDIRLSDPVARSRLNLLIRAQFTDAYKQKSPRTQTMFSFIDSSPEAASAKTQDGAFQLRLSGLLSSIRAQPLGSAPFQAPAGTGEATQ
jgi:type II secretion system protein N